MGKFTTRKQWDEAAARRDRAFEELRLTRAALAALPEFGACVAALAAYQQEAEKAYSLLLNLPESVRYEIKVSERAKRNPEVLIPSENDPHQEMIRPIFRFS